MKGKTNTFSNNLDYSEKLYVILVTNLTNHSDLNGVIITIKYDNTTESYIWEGREFVINIPVGVEYTVSFNEVAGYKTPNSYTYTALLCNRYIRPIYYTELLTVNVSAEEGEINDYEIIVSAAETIDELYIKLEYIESTGEQYINTEFNPSYNTRVVVDIEGLGTSQGFVFGAKDTNSATAPNQFALYRNSSTTIRSDYFGSNKSLSLSDASLRTVVDFNRNVVSLFGSTITNTSVDSGSCTNTLHLFALMSAGTIKYPGTFKMYSCKIYDDDTLVRDYVPAKDLSGNVGLYDLVNNTFTISATSTNFIAGLEEIEADILKIDSTTYKIPFNILYTVSVDDIDGYRTPTSQSFLASLENRVCSMVYSTGLPAGTTYEFEYTGTILEVELPKGRYKLLCWGAQGGNVTGTYAVAGSKGGYSEGEITLTEPTTFYVFVGGKGTNYTSSPTQTATDWINGGWNGGGGGRRTINFENTTYNIKVFPRSGGGATDISTVTSSTMDYSGGHTVRDQASRLARCIVAGGGAGACASYQISKEGIWVKQPGIIFLSFDEEVDGLYHFSYDAANTDKNKPIKYEIVNNYGFSMVNMYVELVYYDNITLIESTLEDNAITFIAPDGEGSLRIHLIMDGQDPDYGYRLDIYNLFEESFTKSGTTNVGGGTTGGGLYPGKQNYYGGYGYYNGGFGYGGDVLEDTTAYKGYVGGAGGAGWYGGGTDTSSSSDSISKSGGGSGFVNIASNASYRPSGYTGLELDSGTTIAGNVSFESVSGGTEKGHSGNGYARITAL